MTIGDVTYLFPTRYKPGAVDNGNDVVCVAPPTQEHTNVLRYCDLRERREATLGGGHELLEESVYDTMFDRRGCAVEDNVEVNRRGRRNLRACIGVTLHDRGRGHRTRIRSGERRIVPTRSVCALGLPVRVGHVGRDVLVRRAEGVGNGTGACKGIREGETQVLRVPDRRLHGRIERVRARRAEGADHALVESVLESLLFLRIFESGVPSHGSFGQSNRPERQRLLWDMEGRVTSTCGKGRGRSFIRAVLNNPFPSVDVPLTRAVEACMRPTRWWTIVLPVTGIRVGEGVVVFRSPTADVEPVRVRQALDLGQIIEVVDVHDDERRSGRS